MADEFQFDVFLSHSAKVKAVIRDLAARLQRDEVFAFRGQMSCAKFACIH